jgi:hypothetical protein
MFVTHAIAPTFVTEKRTMMRTAADFECSKMLDQNCSVLLMGLWQLPGVRDPIPPYRALSKWRH